MTRSWEQQRERGTLLALKATLWCTRLLGRTLTRLVLFPITAYFLVFAGPARRASRDYLRRVLGREPGIGDVARHFHCLASVTLDRMFLLRRGAKGFDVRIHRPPGVEAVADREHGCLLVLAHLGGYEALRLGITARRARPLRILMDLAVGRKLMSLLTALNPDLAGQLIDASERGPGLVLKLRDALEQGAFIGIMADRATAEERAIEVDFLGGRARFAVGPWMLASVVGVPVILAFGLYRGGNRYDAHLELFSERVVLPRGDREEALRACVQGYAARLEHYARLAPYNWFNFYDYWVKPPAVAAPATP